MELLRLNAERRGFAHLSDYVRFMTLDAELVISMKIEEIHQCLLGEPELDRRSRKLKARIHRDAVYSKK